MGHSWQTASETLDSWLLGRHEQWRLTLTCCSVKLTAYGTLNYKPTVFSCTCKKPNQNLPCSIYNACTLFMLPWEHSAWKLGLYMYIILPVIDDSCHAHLLELNNVDVVLSFVPPSPEDKSLAVDPRDQLRLAQQRGGNGNDAL